MLKRFLSIFTISLILTGSFFSIYSFDYPVYADSTTDEWMNVTTNDQLAEAFRYYCKSRDLTIEGSVADAVTSFTTQTFNALCNTIGIDETALQAHLKYKTDSNLGLRFLFDSQGISLYNRIFAQFLQDNEIEVGDVVDKPAMSGDWYDTGNGGAFIYVARQTNPTQYVQYRNRYSLDSNFSQIGTYYSMTDSDMEYLYNTYSSSGSGTLTFNINGNAVNLNYVVYIYNDDVNANNLSVYDNSTATSYEFKCITVGARSYEINSKCHPAIIKKGNDYYLGVVGQYVGQNYLNASAFACCTLLGSNTEVSPYVSPVTINITTNNNTINNNNYEGDTIINNNGDTNNYPDNPDDPDDPDDPDIPDPNPNPTPDPPTIPDSGGWQDFSLPEMPNDWLIYGMEKKFPFDIPFNIMFALSLLNHEPEIPKFEGDIDLKVCTWHYDIDLTPFDDLATILRKFEVLAFIIGLAILTKNLINWG